MAILLPSVVSSIRKVQCIKLLQANCLKNEIIKCAKRSNSEIAAQSISSELTATKLIQLHGKWPAEQRHHFLKDMRIMENFISVDEEAAMLEEIEPYMQRLHYEFDHWDDAIHGFRETERKHWYPHNRAVLERVREAAFAGAVMPFVHILDLAEQGVIKPHVDSTRYCGNTIAGISLLSDCVMRLVRTEESKYDQSNNNQQPQTTDAYRDTPKYTLENNFFADLLLPRRSLYIMSHSSRYNFTHEILSNEASQFRDKLVQKKRRISIICRNEPQSTT